MVIHINTLLYLVLELVLIISACLLTPSLSSAQNAEKIVISRTNIEASRFGQYRGTVQIQTRMEDVKALILESESYPEWLHGCKKTQILVGDLSTGKAYIYFLYDAPKLPWYLRFVPRPKDRDMVLRLLWEITDGKLMVNLSDVNPQQEPDLEGITIPGDSSLTTVKQATVSWAFVAVGQDRIDVIHEMYIDPNHKGTDMGVMNKYVKDMVRKSLENIKTRFNN